jgi:hypothetical protein
VIPTFGELGFDVSAFGDEATGDQGRVGGAEPEAVRRHVEVRRLQVGGQVVGVHQRLTEEAPVVGVEELEQPPGVAEGERAGLEFVELAHSTPVCRSLIDEQLLAGEDPAEPVA